MAHRATITLDDEAHAFLAQGGASNKSAFINALLKEERRRQLGRAVVAANQEEADDPDYRRELAEWEVTFIA